MIYSSLGFMDSMIYFNSSRATSCWSDLLHQLLLSFSSPTSKSELERGLLFSDPTQQNSGSGEGEDDSRPSPSFRDSQSSSRIVFQKRIAFSREGSVQQQAKGGHQIAELDDADPSRRLVGEEWCTSVKIQEDSGSSSSEEGEDSEGMSILFWARQHKRSFLDIDFPLVLHHNEETIE
jgi:hypothetical protein